MSAVVVSFDVAGPFAAHRAACNWCREHGISVGSMCGHEPIGLMVGDFAIAKWKNLATQERAELHGTMTGDMRHGPVKIAMREHCPAFGATP